MNISLHAPINFLSYGIVSKNILKCLSKENRVSLFTIGQINGIDEGETQTVLQSIENAKTFDYNAPCVKIFHAHDLHIMPKCGQRIGFPIFELDKFSDVEIHSLSSCDRLFVCSHWAKSVCENQLNLPVSVVPLGVDTSVFKPTQPKSEAFTILSVGKIEIRKGHDLIPSILRDALPNENYKLLMSWSNPFITESENAEWERFYRTQLGDKVVFLPRLQESELVDIMSSSHVVLSPSRAEGWNLSLLEAMACGTQVITTNYSAHTEYCNDKNSRLIDIDSIVPADDGVWFHGTGNWAEPSVKHAVELIRDEYDRWFYNSSQQQNLAGIETAKQFSWENTAQKIMDNL